MYIQSVLHTFLFLKYVWTTVQLNIDLSGAILLEVLVSDVIDKFISFISISLALLLCERDGYRRIASPGPADTRIGKGSF